MIQFSVIIPNYNHSNYLTERIESVLNQSYQDFEIIILDDASTDNSRQVIEKYRAHTKVKAIIYNQKNTGLQTLQWIKGIEAASFDRIWIAESDDIAEPNFLNYAATEIGKQNKAVVYYTDSYHMKSAQKDLSQQKFSSMKGNYFNTQHWNINYSEDGIVEIDTYMKYVCTINNVSCCVVPKKEALDVLYQFPHMVFYNDWLFYIQMLERCPVVYSASCQNWYRIHQESHFSTRGTGLIKRKECFNILCYLYKAPYITGKNKLVRFFTEQYLGIGIWKERKYIVPLFAFCLKRSPAVFLKFLTHLLVIKITRKKIKYIF